MEDISHEKHVGRNIAIIAAIIPLILALVLFFQNMGLREQVKNLKSGSGDSMANEEVVIFMQDFIDTVLKSENEVPYRDRVRLASGVLDLEDEEALRAWEVFVESENEEIAQDNLVNLLDVLVKKILVK
jgi:hypothetical protein